MIILFSPFYAFYETVYKLENGLHSLLSENKEMNFRSKARQIVGAVGLGCGYFMLISNWPSLYMAIYYPEIVKNFDSPYIGLKKEKFTADIESYEFPEETLSERINAQVEEKALQLEETFQEKVSEMGEKVVEMSGKITEIVEKAPKIIEEQMDSDKIETVLETIEAKSSNAAQSFREKTAEEDHIEMINHVCESVQKESIFII